MENNLKFNSAICTSRSQSERLIALGLKKETADMGLTLIGENEWIPFMKGDYIHEDDIPAWSLHRLLNLIQQSLNISKGITIPLPYDVPFDDCIERIEHLIKEGYFNKEYLEETL